MGVRLGLISCEGPRDGRAQLRSPLPPTAPWSSDKITGEVF